MSALTRLMLKNNQINLMSAFLFTICLFRKTLNAAVKYITMFFLLSSFIKVIFTAYITFLFKIMQQ